MTSLFDFLDPKVQRAWMLLQQNRYELAEKELRQALTEQPNSGAVHAILAIALSRQNQHQLANDEAEAAVGLSPDDSFVHYVHSAVLTQGNCLAEAEVAIRRAIEMDSSNEGYFAQLATILMQQKRWQETLAAAEQGLELDPEHAACVNLRSLALNALGRPIEASSSLRGALERDPEDSWTHANLGWTLLEDGRANEAMEHFREALRLDPDLEYARIGIITAMKARNILFRPLLWYFLKVQKLQEKHQWTMIIGLYIGMRVVRQVGANNPALEPWTTALLYLYMGFVLSTWLGNTLFNLVLSLDSFGRLVLSKDEIATSRMVGSALLIAAGLFVASFYYEIAFFAALGVLLSTLPLSLVFKAEEGWPRWAIAAMAALLMAMGVGPLLTVALSDLLPPLLLLPLALFSMGSLQSMGMVALGSQILSQVLITRKPRRINPRRL